MNLSSSRLFPTYCNGPILVTAHRSLDAKSLNVFVHYYQQKWPVHRAHRLLTI